MAVVDTLEDWAAQVLELEKQMAVISLQLAELRVKLSFARRRHKQNILEKNLAGLGLVPPAEAQELMMSPSESDVAGEHGAGAEMPEPPPPPLPHPVVRKVRVMAPSDVCKACFREGVSGGKHPGVQHLWVAPCTKERQRARAEDELLRKRSSRRRRLTRCAAIV